jgi:hypothetical protein
MARKPPVSPEVQRAADQPAGPRTEAVSPYMLAAARRGELTRSNTTAGTEGRKAVDARTYQRRQAKAPAGVTARQATGHPKGTDQLPTVSYFRADGTYVVRQAVTRGEARRINRVNALSSNLVQNNISEREYARRVRSYKPLPNGDRFLSDPATLIASWEELRAAGEDPWHYESGRS